ncbi:methyltransferase family protein [Chitinophaga skermanii]|uniref:Methyltransferase family protein n=1 Tax=Chitinophaga skermanii TaxID=331697 RepID=A0A327Q910_9BACT|nr:class I SAM-dependent methyltransferase [Chitinophaga skermanii]RAJ00298.1 methyltransferase family protein [Chitinophaga skermanii]
MSVGNQVALAQKFVRYFFGRGNRHDVHSPFIYQLADEVFRDTHPKPAYAPVEALRNRLLHDNTVLQVTDLGAGSLTGASKSRKVNEITKNAAKPAKFGQLFFRMIQQYNVRNVLELGTSMGISTSYMASANPNTTVYTIEGCPNIAQKAKENFESVGLKNIRQFVGNFDDVLGDVLKEMPQLDFVYIDGNHRKLPTIAYYEQCLEKAHDNTVFIFDDIHWTDGMEEAWEVIKAHPRTQVTVDLFFIGLVFLQTDFKAKQHYTLKY